MYGKMKIELKYFLNAMLVLVTRYAKMPPNRIANVQDPIARIVVLSSGVHRLVLASLDVNRSM